MLLQTALPSRRDLGSVLRRSVDRRSSSFLRDSTSSWAARGSGSASQSMKSSSASPCKAANLLPASGSAGRGIFQWHGSDGFFVECDLIWRRGFLRMRCRRNRRRSRARSVKSSSASAAGKVISSASAGSNSSEQCCLGHAPRRQRRLFRCVEIYNRFGCDRLFVNAQALLPLPPRQRPHAAPAR